ncbi:MAG TPA: Mrp/NBP35 family ATP-binding protein [Bacteriovoracaceae bacterium]|nr:Mrp/NBP35 family ATP-binding protein [Bacteriovoracaceae bacterium]
MDSIRKLLDQVKNPQTNKTLSEENRWQEIDFKDGKLSIQYQRDGISPQDKRVIENHIHELLAEVSEVKEVLVKTTSTQSQDVFKAVDAPQDKVAATTPKANLKTGHAPAAKKRPVPGVGKVIAIGSGKGGVGKSTFTANLALTLSRAGKKVGIIDADIYGPSMPMIFGKRDEKPRATENKKIVPIEAHGIKFMSFGLFIEENDPVIWRGPMLGGVLNQFLFDVDWQSLDYLLIDLPPGTGDIQLSMVQNTHVDGTIVISTPQDIALLDATKGLEMFKKLEIPVVGMVENMSSFVCSGCGKDHHIFGDSGVEKAAEKLGVNLLGKVPLEIELREGSDIGKPYMSEPKYEGRAVWNAFTEIAGKVDGYFHPSSPSKQEGKNGFFSKILGLGK